MWRSLPVVLLFTAVALAGCAPNETSQESSELIDVPSTSPISLPPEEPLSTTPGPCPYLDVGFVEQANGQRVTGTGTDDRFDPPACVFLTYRDEPQLEVTVHHTGSVAEARAVVDRAAPVDSTSLADSPVGWSGGRSGGEDGAIYAVSKETVAVVVRSNQAESVKAQAVAEEAITNLDL